MIAGQRPAPFGRNTSARRRAPSRIGMSRSLSKTRSWRGCDPAALPPATVLLDLDIRLAQELTPAERLLAHELGELLRRLRQLHRHHLLGEAVPHLGLVQHRG